MPSEPIKANIQWGPGPRLIVRARVNPAAWAIHTEEGIFVAEIREREGAKHYASLFAQSPELYEVLAEFVKYATCEDFDLQDIQDVAIRAIPLLAKCRGESPDAK